MTLLFALFVVMYASSTVNEKKYSKISNSLVSAFDPRVIKMGDKPEASQSIMTEDKSLTTLPMLVEPAAVTKLKNDAEALQRAKQAAIEAELTRALKPLIQNGKISIVRSPKGIRIDMNDGFLFSQGSSKIADARALATLQEIAPIILSSGQSAEIEGHTDNTPIKTNAYSSNWELSAIRATTVLEILMKNGIGEDRLSATGFGSSRPVAANDSPENKSKNRRVSIIILHDRLDQKGSDLLNQAAEVKP